MFKYEMHSHSRLSGGGDDITSHIEQLRKKGFSGMVITNHFFRGDTKVDRTYSWTEFVDAYKQDYENGKKIARLYDFDLLFGFEEHIGDGREVLVYGVTPEFLYAHPEIKRAEINDFVAIVHKEGGLVFQAHPFRDRWYIAKPTPMDELPVLDGFEVYNAGNHDDENKKAEEFSKTKKYRLIAGSDAHSSKDAGRAGIISNVRLRTEKDLATCLKTGNYRILK